MKKPVMERMLKALKANRGRVAFTTAQAKRRFGISGVRQRIYDLRNDGYPIESVVKYVNGKRTTGYKLARKAA